MTPQALWHDDIFDAIRADVGALGGPKTVGLLLWPEKPADAAARQLLDCLNRDRNQRLSPEQLSLVIKEARKANSFCTIAFICGDASLSMPLPLEPEDERARLQREVVRAASDFKQLITRLEKLGA